MDVSELISPGFLLQAGGYLLVVGVAFGALRARVKEIAERQIDHEDRDETRFNSIDESFHKVQRKLTSVGEDVAEIKGLLRGK